jgi:integrase
MTTAVNADSPATAPAPAPGPADATALASGAADPPRRGSRMRGQLSTAELVDQYGVANRAIRDVFVRYLDERRPGMDYASLRVQVSYLVGNFWADIEQHHPGIDTLDLPRDVVQAWKQRMLTVTVGGVTRPRRTRLTVFMKVRAFYLDIAEWALEDPSWVPWAVPSPIRRGDTAGYVKTRKQSTAEMHQRVRERLPHLPTLIDAAERYLATAAERLHTAVDIPVGASFEHDGTTYRRVPRHREHRRPDGRHVLVEDLTTGRRIDLLRAEDHAFWAWAAIETLRHTGVRVEELLEITHLALISYRLPDTGEIVPLLQIIPSKSNEERLLLVGPELASVLATIITRVRADNGGVIPLVARYDQHERVTGPPLPHLFQRTSTRRTHVISPHAVGDLLTATLARTGLTDAAGAPLRYTPHDFRRIFATDAVTGGLPVHIVARLLGHANLATTQAYTAVFQDDLVRAYRTFLDQRRAVRPEAEYREPTDAEWRDFHEHFELRKLELGTCARPYGSPCKHEHACIRCPMMRVDPQQRPRLITIIRNLADRITEARMNHWHGEVEGLQISLDAARAKLVALDRTTTTTPGTNIANLGIPVIRSR